MALELPDLDIAVLEDDQALWEVLNEVIIKAPSYRAQRKAIVGEQLKLRAMIPERAWRQYLVVENLINIRTEGVIVGLVRWAFEQGARALACHEGRSSH